MKDKLSCYRCKKPISGARTVIEVDGAPRYHCGDCTYLISHPDAEVVKRKRQKPVLPDPWLEMEPIAKESRAAREAREQAERYQELMG